MKITTITRKSSLLKKPWSVFVDGFLRHGRQRTAMGLAAAVAALAAFGTSQAAVRGPYSDDPNTVFLFHMDEPATAPGISTNSAAASTGTNLIATSNLTAATTRYATAGILGSPSAFNTNAGDVNYNYGTCANITTTSMGLFLDGNANGQADLDVVTTPQVAAADALVQSSICGADGSFTIEALINVASITVANREIVSMDSSLPTSGRPFQFRITTGGQINFNNIAGGPNVNGTIPTTGADAFVAGQWYHVAVAYNGDPANRWIKLYWSKLSNLHTNCTLIYSNSCTAPVETGSAVLTAGNENRNASGEGLIGLIDEVRISNIARADSDMVFNAVSPQLKPVVNVQPGSQFLGVGETLAINALVTGSSPLSYYWYKNSGSVFTNLASQTASQLSLPVTFGTAGQYYYVVSNTYGTATSSVASVTVGAVFHELFKTSFDDAGNMTAAGSVDPHYTLASSATADVMGPDTTNCTGFTDGNYNADDANSSWISAYGRISAGTSVTARGVYTYRTHFLIDGTQLSSAVISNSILSAGPVSIWLNGNFTGVANSSPAAPGPYRNAFSYALTNGFVAGLNTLDFVVTNSSNVALTGFDTALRVLYIRGIGAALAAGVPTISTQPVDDTVRDGGTVAKSVVALGRPPLAYQWFDHDTGLAITGATNRTLPYSTVSAGSQPANFVVVVTNDSGSITSRVAALTIVETNQFPLVPNYTYTIYSNTTLNVRIDSLYYSASDPDGDTWTIAWDGGTVNGVGLTQTGSTLSYVPGTDYLGTDLFTYQITDSQGATVAGNVNINVVASVAPAVTSSASTGYLTLQATGATPGGSYTVISTTDLSTAMADWTVESTGVFDAAGNATFSAATTGTTAAKFFTIRLP